MIDIVLLWDFEDDPDGNVAHISEHGVTIEDVEEVFADPDAETEDSRNSTRSITFGETRDGRYLAVLWEVANEDPLMGYPITAYPVPRPRSRR